MKRFLAKAGIYVIPFLIILLLFFVFEPYDYLCLKGDAAYRTMPLSSMRALMNEQPSRIILGDSKVANLNTEYIYDLTGERYHMLGFGGATMGECIELFWFAANHSKLDTVYFGLGFYIARGEYNPGRLVEMENRAVNPLRFLSDFNYWLEAINSAKETFYKAVGRDVPAAEDPTRFDLLETPTVMGDRYRLDLETYAKEVIYPNCEEMKNEFLDSKTLDAIDEMIVYCQNNDIELTFVFTPTHESIETFVLNPLGLDGVTETLKSYVRGRANVLDMEFSNDFTRNDDNFYDGFHLSGPNKKLLAELLFTDMESAYIIRQYV